MALLHHITVDVPHAAFFALKRRAAAGVDAVTWNMDEERGKKNLCDLHARVHAGTYRALSSRRTVCQQILRRARRWLSHLLKNSASRSWQ